MGITRRSHARKGEARRADHRGKPSRCLEYSKGRYPKWRTPQLVEYSPETDTSTGERRAWKLASGVRRGARGKGRCESYLACGLPYFLLGFVGPKEEAEEIKQRLRTFLQEELKLELSAAKTLITHAKTETARFLNYEIHTIQEDSQRDQRDRRSHNGNIGLRIPEEVIQNKCQRYQQHSRKVLHRTELINDSDFTIIELFQAEYRGLVEYYRLAYNLHRLTTLEGVMEQSLTKTLAAKHKLSVPKVYRKYQALFREGKKCFKVLQTVIEREGKKSLVARWGGISLHWDIKAPIKDQWMFLGPGRSELEKRLLADTCEFCGTAGDAERMEVHVRRFGGRDRAHQMV